MSVYFQQVAAITIKSLVNHHRFHAAAGRASHLLLHNLILITIPVIRALFVITPDKPVVIIFVHTDITDILFHVIIINQVCTLAAKTIHLSSPYPPILFDILESYHRFSGSHGKKRRYMQLVQTSLPVCVRFISHANAFAVLRSGSLK